MSLTLSDITELIVDTKHKTPKFVEQGYPCIRTPNIGRGNFILDKVKYVSEETYNEWNEKVEPKPDDLILAREAPIGNVAIIPSGLKLCIGQRTVLIRPDRDAVNPRYLNYLLLSDDLQHKMQALSSGVTVPHLNMGDIRNLKIPKLPSREYQNKIAYILSAYDDLIENNTRRIRILEEMAQAIYREWFVEFRLPAVAGVPGVKLRKTTPEEKKAIGKDVIPEGWEVVKIGDLIEKIPRRKKIKKQEYQEKGIYPVVDQGREFIGGYTNERAAVNDNPLPVIVFGDHTRIVKYIDFPFACGADGTQLLYPNNKRMPITLFYYAINNIDLKDYAYSRHFKFLKEKTTLLPDEFISNEFNSIVEPIREKIRILRTQINNLRQTRDLLLPKLVSGEVKV